MIGIVVTSKIEWKAILDEYGIDNKYSEKYIYGEYYRTKIYDKEIVFFRTQKRKTLSSGAVQYMIDKFHFEKIIYIGSCTGISSYVNYNDIIIPTSLCEIDTTINDIEPVINENNTIILDETKIKSKYFDGLLASQDKMIVLDKDYEFAKKLDIVAVDTESASIARICKMNNINIIIIKGITDRPCDNNLDEQIDVFEENAPRVIKNIIENYLVEVL